MAQNLWELRQKQKMTVKQLAGKSGVKAGNIYAYESGEAIKIADLGKLAKALYVDSSEIKIESEPIPKKKPAPPKPVKPATPPPAAKAAEARATAEMAPAKKQAAPSPKSAPAREGQLSYLRDLAAKVGESETAVTERIGKAIDELTSQEARHWIGVYLNEHKNLRPADTRRKRAHLPEGVDSFELNYLEAQQEAQSRVTFTLFDNTQFSGRIVGFSPYSITIEQEDGSQTSLQKLALAYYTVSGEAA